MHLHHEGSMNVRDSMSLVICRGHIRLSKSKFQILLQFACL